jgi:23S rRNA (guanine745-N1)-methyltransferase
VLADVAGSLRCPHCRAALSPSGAALRCEAGHAFDVARQGYVNLLPGNAQAGTADTAAMVEARAAFLAAGHYEPLIAAVAAACAAAGRVGHAGEIPSPPLVVDIGAGTGAYLAAALERLPGRAGLALDLSKHAARRAARAHPRIGAVVCDAWRELPVRDGAAALALCAFAPRNAGELRRILDPRGALVVVTPTDRHLAGLVTTLGLLSVDERKQERLAAQLDPGFELVDREHFDVPLSLDHAAVEALIGMGPSARHLAPDVRAERIAALPQPLAATASVAIATYRPR